MSIKFMKDGDFLIPTTELKNLLLLEQIENRPDVTQRELAKYINAAPSMINKYINTLEEAEYIKKEKQEKENLVYRITEEGRQRKNYLLVSYITELSYLYNAAKSNIQVLLRKITDKNIQHVILYGAGETGDVVINVVNSNKDYWFSIAAIADDDPLKQGKEMMGYPIISPDEIVKFKNVEAIVITTFAFEGQVKDRLKNINYPEEKIISFYKS